MPNRLRDGADAVLQRNPRPGSGPPERPGQADGAPEHVRCRQREVAGRQSAQAAAGHDRRRRVVGDGPVLPQPREQFAGETRGERGTTAEFLGSQFGSDAVDHHDERNPVTGRSECVDGTRDRQVDRPRPAVEQHYHRTRSGGESGRFVYPHRPWCARQRERRLVEFAAAGAIRPPALRGRRGHHRLGAVAGLRRSGGQRVERVGSCAGQYVPPPLPARGAVAGTGQRFRPGNETVGATPVLGHLDRQRPQVGAGEPRQRGPFRPGAVGDSVGVEIDVPRA